jgi:hypothetical protein
MQRYHDINKDPLPIHSPQHEIERTWLDQQVAEFLARGGKVQQVGYQMSNAPATFVIDAQRSPVYAHLFVPATSPEPLPAISTEVREVAADQAKTVQLDDQDVQHAAVIMASAALGESPKWIAKKHHMTEKRVRQIARDYRIPFRKQR